MYRVVNWEMTSRCIDQSGSKLQFDTPILFVVVESTGLPLLTVSLLAVSLDVEARTGVKVSIELLLAIVTSVISLELLLMAHSWQFVLVLGTSGYSGGGKPIASIIRR